MKARRLAGVLLACSLLASALQAGPNDNPPPRAPKPPPKESCQPSCVVMRVSTRCRCSLGKTLPAVETT
jgi:hypothetical protein